MIVSSAPRAGQQVRARRDLHGGLTLLGGGPTVRQGARGLIVEVEPGGFLLGERYVVEFATGLTSQTMRVRRDDIRVLALGGGPESWRRRRELERGVRLGVFLAFGLPTLWALAVYFVHGGTIADLVIAVPGELVALVIEAIATIGFVPTLLLVAGALVVGRWRR